MSFRWETGAAAPTSYGPHPAPQPDPADPAWFPVYWPEYTTRPLPKGQLWLRDDAFIGMNPSAPGDPPLTPLDWIAYTETARNLGATDELPAASRPFFWSEPGKESAGGVWLRKYVNAFPSGKPGAPIAYFGKAGPPPKPTGTPPAPADRWALRWGWVWDDSGPGFWRPRAEWRASVGPPVEPVITLPARVGGVDYTWRSDSGLTGKEFRAAAASGAVPSDKAAAEAQKADTELAAAIDKAKAGALPGWVWILGVGAVAYLLARRA